MNVYMYITTILINFPETTIILNQKRNRHIFLDVYSIILYFNGISKNHPHEVLNEVELDLQNTRNETLDLLSAYNVDCCTLPFK